MKPVEVSVIVPVWNGRALLEKLLASLRLQTYPIAEILIVDNGSDDGAPELAESAGARVIRMGWNAGFARAVNRGVQQARGEWLALVNTDVEAQPDWLEKLMQAAAAPDTWFITGKILSASERDRIDGTYDAMCRGGVAVRIGRGRLDGPLFSTARAIWFAPATAAIYRAELFRRIGPLEESFESYLEDVEFGLRGACLGYAGSYAPEAVAYHVGSATLGKMHPDTVRRTARNQVLIIAKYYRGSFLVRSAWAVLVAQALWGVVALRQGVLWSFFVGKAQGLGSFIAARRSAMPVDAARLEAVLLETESDMLRVFAQIGFGKYWWCYFLLTAPWRLLRRTSHTR
ncbi:MAG: glycosyltransferase family 2 protein [Candidatus Solibacter usitatus]|nr:glycosyltransferase family 2 protein [Candidatus Solibacter usitatus]